jgi:hypothetical protein
MSMANGSNYFGNNIVVLFFILAVLSAYLGHAIGRGDKENYLEQQKNEQKIEQIK